MFRFREIKEVKTNNEFADIERCKIPEEVMTDLMKIAEEAWNLPLQNSIETARAAGVEEKDILHNKEEIDKFFES